MSPDLTERLQRLRDDARALANDLHDARQSAEPFTPEKAGARYAGRYLEKALPHLERAAMRGDSK